MNQTPIPVPFAPADLDALYMLLMRHPQALPFEALERIIYTIRSAASAQQPVAETQEPAQEPQKAEGAPEGAPLVV